MLILKRNIGQGLQIGDEIIVALTRLRDNRIEVGISAPQDLQITRLSISELRDGRINQLEDRLRAGTWQ